MLRRILICIICSGVLFTEKPVLASEHPVGWYATGVALALGVSLLIAGGVLYNKKVPESGNDFNSNVIAFDNAVAAFEKNTIQRLYRTQVAMSQGIVFASTRVPLTILGSTAGVVTTPSQPFQSSTPNVPVGAPVNFTIDGKQSVLTTPVPTNVPQQISLTCTPELADSNGQCNKDVMQQQCVLQSGCSSAVFTFNNINVPFCAKNSLCGICSTYRVSTSSCMQITFDPATQVWTQTPGMIGCDYPFSSQKTTCASTSALPTELPVQFVSSDDPYIILQTQTRGSRTFGTPPDPAPTDPKGGQMLVAGGIITAVPILLVAAACFIPETPPGELGNALLQIKL